MTWKHTFALVASAVAITWLRKFIGGATNPHDGASMLGKTCIVTGANTGIGLETAKQLLRQNATGMVRGAAERPFRASLSQRSCHGLPLSIAMQYGHGDH